MNPAFGLQVTVRKVAGYKESDRFDACFVAVLDINDLAAESASLDPSLIHSTKHVRPIARFSSSGTRMNRKEGIVLIELTGKKHFQFETLQLSYQCRVFLLYFPEGGCLRFELLFLSREANEHIQVIGSLNQRREGLHL